MVQRSACGYVWGPINAEDLAPVPGTEWIVTSGMTGPGAPAGRLYAIHRHDLSCNEIFPYLLDFALDDVRFGEQAAINAASFASHGIDVRLRDDGVAELYAVNHGGRESVEVFEIELTGSRPRLIWIGGAELPGTSIGNDVAALGNGGFVVSTTGSPDGRDSPRDVEMSGGDTGGVLEWSPATGWRELPGTQINVANGVAVSADGQWVYVAGWSGRCIKRVERGPADPQVTVMPMPIMVDNLTWADDGSLLAAGAFDTTVQEFVEQHFSSNPRTLAPSRILRIDRETLAWDVLVEYGGETFGAATTGLQVGDEIWVGAARDQGVARFKNHLHGERQ